jgi:ABC-type multidrug transport system fused ATPase/permease subunit
MSHHLLQGYDTLVGEQFSTDLKQRIAMARTVIHDPRILIIDDITSHHVTEIQDNQQLIDTFRKVMADRTTIILSQRLPIIQHANTIHVLEVISTLHLSMDKLYNNVWENKLNITLGNSSDYLDETNIN